MHHPDFVDTQPLTEAELEAFRRGREYEAPRSYRAGAAHAKIRWLCLGMCLACVLVGSFRCTGIAP
jgi:hypothetical protein